MNSQHLRAFLWLRWRLRANQFRKGGVANAVLFILLSVCVVIISITLFIVFLLLGLFGLSEASPLTLLFVWDGLVLGLLFFWAIGLLTELQRSDALSLDKFLHLPVSVAGAYLINYLSSLFSVNLIFFVPAVLGLSLGLLFTKGPAMLLLLPLIAAFLFMLTALTYQFQGWLASLMVNKRRRRTVIMAVTVAFIMLFQLPNLINIYQPWKGSEPEDRAARRTEQQESLRQKAEAGQIKMDDYEKQLEALQKEFKEEDAEAKRTTWEKVGRIGKLMNQVLPPGWLPLGAMGLAEGNIQNALLGIGGLTLIGSFSLWRGYRTTLRIYMGQFTSGKVIREPVAVPTKTAKPTMNLLEKDLPWLSEHAAAIALCGLRSLTRAPEAKMLLLAPVIMIIVFGGILLKQGPDLNMPERVRPLLACGAMAMILLTLTQMAGNQFAFDRSGFRVFVLCPASRRDILLGKNLSIAPLSLGLGLLSALLMQMVLPMRVDYFLAVLVQFISMYLVYCMLANLISVLVPMPIAAGTLKPSSPKLIPILCQVLFTFLLPVAFAPIFLPLGIEYVLEWLGWISGWPICLALSLLECVGIVFLYRLVLTWEGSLLQSWEQKILETVASKPE